MNLSSCFTDHVQLLLRLTYFQLSYCPLLKLNFPNFFVSPYQITTCLGFILMNLYRHISYQVLLLGPFDLCL